MTNDNPAELLVVYGPPNEWSGSVALALGPERRRLLLRTWKSLSSEEQREVRDKWEGKKLAAAPRGASGFRAAQSAADLHGTFGKAKGLYRLLVPQDIREKTETRLQETAEATPGVKEVLQHTRVAQKNLGTLQKHAEDRSEAKHEVAGLGVLALPSAVSLASRLAPKSQRLGQAAHVLEQPSVVHGVELAGLGILAKPSIQKLMKKESTALDPFLSKEKKQALQRVETHHRSSSDTKWDTFLDHASRKSFATALMRDPRSDEKLVRHVDQMNRLLTGKVLGQVQGKTGTYDIVWLRGGGLGCTCNDWRFKKSVSPSGEQDCKHIREWRARKGATKSAAALSKLAASSTEVATGAGAGLATGGLILSGQPQKLVGRAGTQLVKRTGGETVTPDQMAALGKKYNIKITQGPKSSANVTARKVQLGGGTGNMATLHHELGHIQDKGWIDRSKLQKGTVKHTAATLRNEAAANFNAVRSRGLKQLPHAIGAQGTYLASAAARHKKGLAMLAAPVAAAGAARWKRGHDQPKVAMAASEVSTTGMQRGDVVLTSMGPRTYLGQPGAPALKKLKEVLYRKNAPKLQGGYTHAAIYLGDGQVIEARGDGVRKRSLKDALENIDGAIVVRPKATPEVRRSAATFAEAQEGKPYESELFLGGQGVALKYPRTEKLLDHGKKVEDAERFTCGNLVAASYVSQGFTPRKDEGSWSMTVPADFLVPEKSKKVKTLGEVLEKRPETGRLKNVANLA